MSERDDRLAEVVRRIMDADVARLDDATRDDLRRARRRAMTEAVLQPRPFVRRRWIPAAAVAASVVLVVVLWSRQEPGTPPMAPDDFELLTSMESLEFYQDLDFYQWLERARRREREHAG